MFDLISRQALLESIERISVKGNVIDDDWVYRFIQEFPSIERKKGKWIRHDEIKNVYGGICIECSECGEKYVVQHILDEKYCRNCGAFMRGSDD